MKGLEMKSWSKSRGRMHHHSTDFFRVSFHMPTRNDSQQAINRALSAIHSAIATALQVVSLQEITH
jgi:hypothetical protein